MDTFVQSRELCLQRLHYGTNSYLASFLEFPEDLIPMFTMDILGQRWTIKISSIVAALAGIISWFIPIGIIVTIINLYVSFNIFVYK